MANVARPKTRFRRGFTLIELLVVIAIIALLVSLLMPSLRQAKDLARQAACASHLKQVGNALHMYVPDNDDFMPGYEEYGGTDPDGYVDSQGVSYTRWNRGPLLTHWKHGSIESQPVRDGDGFLGPYTGSRKGGLSAILSCTSAKRGPTFGHYAHNGRAYPMEIWGEHTFGLNYAGTTTWNERTGRFEETRIEKIWWPGQLIYKCDGLGGWTPIYQSFVNDPSYSPLTTPTARHFDEFQIVFCDSHVEVGPLYKFYQPEYLRNDYVKHKGGG